MSHTESIEKYFSFRVIYLHGFDGVVIIRNKKYEGNSDSTKVKHKTLTDSVGLGLHPCPISGHMDEHTMPETSVLE